MAVLDWGPLKKLRRSVEEQVETQRKQLDEMMQRRTSVQLQYAARDDLKRVAQQRIADLKQQALADLGARASNLANSADALSTGNYAAFRLGITGLLPDQPVTAGHLERALVLIAGPQLIEATAKAIDAAEWPGQEGLPMAERTAELARLDAEIEAKRKQLATLIEEARANGLDL